MSVREMFSKYARVMGVLLVVLLTGSMFPIISCDEGGSPFWSVVKEIFEPVNEMILPTIRTKWHIAAEPYQLEGEGYLRGRLLWHTPRNLVPYSDVWEGEAEPGEEIVRTLRFIFRPVGSGTKSWAGVTMCFNKAIPDSIDYFDIRVLGDNGVVHLDFGQVNEDLNDDGYEFTEDLDRNAAVDESEDVGLDGIADGRGEYPSVWGTSDDLAGDNWYFRGEGKCPFGDGCDTIDWNSDEWYYEFLNGTEGNIRDGAVAGIPDAECLCNTNSMSRADAYFSWKVDLTAEDFLVTGSEYNGWRTFRLPIRDGSAVDTVASGAVNPAWEHLRHIRVWMESDESQTIPDTIQIADWRFLSAEE